MKTKFISALFALAITTGISAQSIDTAAFSKSYMYEYNKQYVKAVEAIMGNYNANSYEHNLRLGWLEYLNGDYTKSQNYYNKAIGMEPSSVEARMGLLYPLAAMGNWDQVITVYNDILKQDPNNSTANYRLSSIYYTRKEFDKAMTHAAAVLKLYPFDYDSNMLAGRIAVAQGKIAEAKKYFTKALNYSPTSVEAKEALKKL